MDPDRFVLIADIHGNADALAAVLADIDAREGAGAGIVNLGDHLSGPLDPAGTAALLRGRAVEDFNAWRRARSGSPPRRGSRPRSR